MRRLPLAAAVVLVLALSGGSSAAVEPNDPLWFGQRAAVQLALPQVWEETTGDPSVVIAVVDTGVDRIPDLADAFASAADLVENDSVPQDQDSHGTRVASVIAARGNDGTGVAGFCWKCRLLPVRVSQRGTMTPAAIAAGIRYAAEQGARIINVSLGHAGQDEAEAAAVQYAISRGAIVVAAAGNTGNEVPQYPAAYPDVVSVGGTDDRDDLYFWSSRGPWVKLTAPGCYIVVDAHYPPGELCGTSFTPAAVAGVLGLLWSREPGLTREQVLSAVFGTARPVPGIVYGRVDPLAAFARLGLLRAPLPAAAPAPTPPPTSAPVTAPPARSSRPATRYTRQTLFETGTFKRGFRAPLVVGRGRLELQLLAPRVADCSLTLTSRNEVVVAAPAVRNLLSLAVRVDAGRYTAAVRCRGDRTRQYSFGVIGMFPRLP